MRQSRRLREAVVGTYGKRGDTVFQLAGEVQRLVEQADGYLEDMLDFDLPAKDGRKIDKVVRALGEAWVYLDEVRENHMQ